MTASQQLRKRPGYGKASTPSAQSGSWIVSISNFPAITTIGGAVEVSNFPVSYPVTGTFWPETQPVTGPLTNIELRTAAVAVSADTLPLPSGAATAARQDVGNTSLASIDGKLTAPLTVTGPLTDAQLRASAVPVSATNLDVALSTRALESGGNLASVKTNTDKLDVALSTIATAARQDAQTADLDAIKTAAQAGATAAKQDTIIAADPTPHIRSLRAVAAIQLQILMTPSGGFVPCEISPF